MVYALFLTQFYDFQILDVATINGETDQSPDLVETIYSCRTWVDMKAAYRLVVQHLQYMRMPRDEQLWRTGEKCASNRSIIMTRITPYVLDEHIHFLTFKTIDLRIEMTDLIPVDIAIDSPQRLEGRQPACHLHVTDITSMPNLVAFTEVFLITFVPIAMGVGE